MYLCQQSNISAFNMLSRLVITFLPRSKWFLISWLQSPSSVILELKKSTGKQMHKYTTLKCQRKWGYNESICKLFQVKLFTLMILVGLGNTDIMLLCKFMITVDPWRTWVWIKKVHLYVDFFSINIYIYIYMTASHDLYLVKSTEAEFS